MTESSPEQAPQGGWGARMLNGALWMIALRWAIRLTELAVEPARVAELDLWRGILDPPAAPLGSRALDPARDVVGAARQLSVVLGPEVAGPLLGEVPGVFHAGVNDVLLTALAIAVAEWRPGGGSAVLIGLEGHGRDGEGVDLARTVGWFTTAHPVRLDPGDDLPMVEVLAGGPAMGTAVKRVKEQLRAIPDNGLGYGLLRYLNPQTAPILAAHPEPQLAFNYLGRFDGGTAAATDWGPAPEATETISGGSDPGRPMAYALAVNAVAQDGPDGPRLVAAWSWPGPLFTDDDVQRLADSWFRALAAVVAHAARPDAGGFTPSDLSLLTLSQDEIDEFESDLN